MSLTVPVQPEHLSAWISTSDRLPEGDGLSPVVALRVDAEDEDLRLVIVDVEWLRGNREDFTHWLPLPPQPT